MKAQETHADIRDGVRALCAGFDSAYWQKVDEARAYLEHPVLGSMELFIAPLGPDELGMKYQAIVNRFRK